MQDKYPALSLKETQRAIKLCKDTAETQLSRLLSLERVTAPLLVEAGNGVNDDLCGWEHKVTFDLGKCPLRAEVVQSLAKWKRLALWQYEFAPGEGLYTDMNALRPDEVPDALHSITVDQWDWEKIILPADRHMGMLEDTVRTIVRAIAATKATLRAAFPVLEEEICDKVHFVTSQDLYEAYPTLSPEQREYEITKQYKTVFIEKVGKPLPDGRPHSDRAPDYDDWDLNGDLLFWSQAIDRPIEISSMGIRVNAQSLLSQLKAAGAEDRLRHDYHRLVAEGTLPLTIGGGIGQSRLCMLLMEKRHIGEVQVSVWDEQTRAACRAQGITLL